MNRIAIYSMAAATAIAGSMFLGAGAQAATEHCDSGLYPNKVELGGDSTSVDTGLEPGTQVCIKAGTKTLIVTVDGDGYITQDGIQNKNKNAYLGISYYAYGDEECVIDPYTDECRS
jgi:hypothetical protein